MQCRLQVLISLFHLVSRTRLVWYTQGVRDQPGVGGTAVPGQAQRAPLLPPHLPLPLSPPPALLHSRGHQVGHHALCRSPERTLFTPTVLFLLAKLSPHFRTFTARNFGNNACDPFGMISATFLKPLVLTVYSVHYAAHLMASGPTLDQDTGDL